MADFRKHELSFGIVSVVSQSHYPHTKGNLDNHDVSHLNEMDKTFAKCHQ